jgi:DNA-binding transcriptional LysR family regulator
MMTKPIAWDWNDVRCFLAVLREGSTLRAAEKLGVNQTTCARRIAALEEAIGVMLFERTAGGYVPTPSAHALRDAAEAMEAVAGRFATLADAETRRAKKVLRLTVSTFFAEAVAATIARLREAAPHVVVDVDFSDEVRDLSAGEADLAVRGGFPPAEEGLVVRQLWADKAGVYCTADYATRRGNPTPDTIRNHPLVILAGQAHDMAKAAGLGPSVAQVVNSIEGHLAAVRSGAFIGVLPDFLAASAPDLVKCFDVPEPQLGSWIVFPERCRHDPDHRLLRESLAMELIARAKAGARSPKTGSGGA